MKQIIGKRRNFSAYRVLGLVFAAIIQISQISLACAGTAPKIVASIRPVHSLAAQIMEGVGDPLLLLSHAESPHDSALRPSDMQKLTKADLVIWVGPAMESSIAKIISGTPSDRLITLANEDSLNIIKQQDHQLADYHIWLSPENAVAILRLLASRLSEIDPANRHRYLANEKAAIKKIKLLRTDLQRQLAPYSDADFLVYHEAYGYFERSFGLRATGIVNPTGHGSLSARQLSKVEDIINLNNKNNTLSLCLFATDEEINSPAMSVLAEMGTTPTLLDPIGHSLPPGPDLWYGVMKHIATGFRECLTTTE